MLLLHPLPLCRWHSNSLVKRSTGKEPRRYDGSYATSDPRMLMQCRLGYRMRRLRQKRVQRVFDNADGPIRSAAHPDQALLLRVRLRCEENRVGRAILEKAHFPVHLTRSYDARCEFLLGTSLQQRCISARPGRIPIGVSSPGTPKPIGALGFPKQKYLLHPSMVADT
jgi:hypothetical protein